jgi:class 3 adenylate cyclase
VFVPIALARYLAEQIPGARFVELPGADQFVGAGDVDQLVDEIEEFITGHRPDRPADRVLATILFTDLVDSTRQSAVVGDAEWLARIEGHDAAVRSAVGRHRGRVVKGMGDGFLAVFDSPAASVRAALAIRDAVAALGLAVRQGVHIGEVDVRGDDIAGIAVAIAARVMGLAGPGEVLVSAAVPPLVAGSLLEFDDRGEHDLKGVPGSWRVFAAHA